jgi:hypothetical protein
VTFTTALLISAATSCLTNKPEILEVNVSR